MFRQFPNTVAEIFYNKCRIGLIFTPPPKNTHALSIWEIEIRRRICLIVLRSLPLRSGIMR